MKRITLFLLCAILLCSCADKTTKVSSPDYDYLTVTEYANEYQVDTLIKCTITESQYIKGDDKAQQTSSYERIYTYESGKLVREDEYSVGLSGEKELMFSSIYSGGTEENITWEGADTVSYELREYDSARRLTHRIKRTNVNAPQFDFIVAENFEEWIKYDDKGDVIENIRKGFTTDMSDRDAETVNFTTEMSGDTVISKRYENGIISQIAKRYKSANDQWELIFGAHDRLEMSTVTIDNGDEKIVVIKTAEFNSTDSIFYLNGREVKAVRLFPESKTTEITEYDKFGNISKMMRYEKQNNLN